MAKLLTSVVGLTIGGLMLVPLIMLLFFTRELVQLIAWVVPPLGTAVGWLMVASLFGALPLLAVHRARPFCGLIFSITSWLTMVWIGLVSVGTVYALWGKLVLILLLILFPAMPIAAGVALALEGAWSALGMLGLNFAVAVLLTVGAGWASRLYERRERREALSTI